ncbi:MAG: hypothetical protein KAR42_15610 [candidate division Zixibacteria bacterium]|nr:hypothetical protein [candidate division Zixibacteria bacterium]
MSKKAIILINDRLTFLGRQLLRINQEAKCLEDQKERSSHLCWCCENTGDTTDLVECEIKNKNYPHICEKMENNP